MFRLSRTLWIYQNMDIGGFWRDYFHIISILIWFSINFDVNTILIILFLISFMFLWYFHRILILLLFSLSSPFPWLLLGERHFNSLSKITFYFMKSHLLDFFPVGLRYIPEEASSVQISTHRFLPPLLSQKSHFFPPSPLLPAPSLFLKLLNQLTDLQFSTLHHDDGYEIIIVIFYFFGENQSKKRIFSKKLQAFCCISSLIIKLVMRYSSWLLWDHPPPFQMCYTVSLIVERNTINEYTEVKAELKPNYS